MTSRKDRAVRAWSAFSDSRRQTPVDDSIGYTVSDWKHVSSCPSMTGKSPEAV